MSARTNIYNAISNICKVYAVHDQPARITENCAIIMRKSANESFGNTIAGWDNWIIYIYSPHSPLAIDELRTNIRRALFMNHVEITNDMTDDEYDTDLKCYVCAITCRTPSILYYEKG